MATPFDNRLLLVHWIARTLRPTRDVFGNIDPRANELGISARDFCRWVRQTFPNLHGLSVKVLHGTVFQGQGGSDNPADVRAITSFDRVRDWLRACNEANLELHTWCVPVGRFAGTSLVDREVALLTQLMTLSVDGVSLRSLSLDVEAGTGFWTGTEADARDYWRKLRGSLPNTHVAVILDYRFRRQGREAFITPWAERADSLHPMVYPGEFFPGSAEMPIERETRKAFDELRGFEKTVIPMLQVHDASRPVRRLTRPEEVSAQADWALRLGAPGLTYFRTGTDHFQSSKWPGLVAVQLPGQVPPVPPPIPAHAVVVWPQDPGYTESLFPENPPDAPVQSALDVYGKPIRFKRTFSGQGITVEYRPNLPQRGAYRVEVFIPAGLANALVEYRVMDRPGQPDAEIVTPAIDQGRFSNQWISLGDFDFDPVHPDAGKVSLTDLGPDHPRQTVVFGAMRWLRLPR
jgi:hypothetical protein